MTAQPDRSFRPLVEAIEEVYYLVVCSDAALRAEMDALLKELWRADDATD